MGAGPLCHLEEQSNHKNASVQREVADGTEAKATFFGHRGAGEVVCVGHWHSFPENRSYLMTWGAFPRGRPWDEGLSKEGLPGEAGQAEEAAEQGGSLLFEPWGTLEGHLHRRATGSTDGSLASGCGCMGGRSLRAVPRGVQKGTQRASAEMAHYTQYRTADDITLESKTTEVLAPALNPESTSFQTTPNFWCHHTVQLFKGASNTV